ncbi:hypothetical protein JX265_010302 [Neoarthrinium moseri]|uniref:Uncharacterized protein n=1 Tax=Neoarthrinium moseri TaxID=1658444 RepID=A0A9P9WEM4_9PEZI|nr:uncharacterized protein JN550_003499 [Neoarthrinium moseri]KAI1844245.1 hypothetical protein JX266_009536 [Neoarthrinium moseri]KAI1859853.1 hypothetical protein JX265_010302 [Neoarthrinium moseri]KAI1873246.1 hypothetical protein JN550_003499 [Neoarthrinium moseri]
MRLTTILSLALATNVAVGSSWFPGSKAAYNKWHETELERWLSDHDLPYPTPADRKDLEDLIQKNWDSYAVAPYKSWDTQKLGSYLKQKGIEAKEGTEANKDSLISQVQGSWYETEEKAQNAWGSAKDWILDTWTDSQLKAFADKNGIPVPQPRKRDTLLQQARSSYEAVAKKVGETASYPGNWLYETWSESDLKEWLDTHGFPAPQPSSRDKLIASVRRNSRIAYLKAQDQAASASASANAAYATLTDKIIDAWGESQLKEFADKNNIPVPQGSKLNELRALVRKHRAQILGDSMSASAASAFGAATSNAGNQYAKATNDASLAAQEAFNEAVGTWSDSRLKGYLDARGVPVPHGSKSDELRAIVRKNSHKAASGYNAWTWDDLSVQNLKDYLANSGDAAAKSAANKAGATRDDLVSAAQSAYSSASTAGGDTYASATSYLSKATAAAKQNTFETWSESELKSYLDSYGVPAPQGSKINELRAYARKQATYYKYGTSGPAGTAFAKISEAVKDGYQWVMSQVGAGSDAAMHKAQKAKQEL